jgi:hypothetical protein
VVDVEGKDGFWANMHRKRDDELFLAGKFSNQEELELSVELDFEVVYFWCTRT